MLATARDLLATTSAEFHLDDLSYRDSVTTSAKQNFPIKEIVIIDLGCCNGMVSHRSSLLKIPFDGVFLGNRIVKAHPVEDLW